MLTNIKHNVTCWKYNVMFQITVNALIKRGSLYLQAYEREKSLKDFETAENLDPNNPDLYLHRGQVCQKLFLN